MCWYPAPYPENDWVARMHRGQSALMSLSFNTNMRVSNAWVENLHDEKNKDRCLIAVEQHGAVVVQVLAGRGRRAAAR